MSILYLYVSLYSIFIYCPYYTRACSSHISFNINRRASFLKALTLSTIEESDRGNSSESNNRRTVPKRVTLNLNSDKDYDIITFIAKQMRSNFLFQSCDHATIVNLARQFVVCEYDPGFAIIEQGKSIVCHILFTYTHIHILIYILIQGMRILICVTTS